MTRLDVSAIYQVKKSAYSIFCNLYTTEPFTISCIDPDHSSFRKLNPVKKNCNLIETNYLFLHLTIPH
jgi:hypothetical protein